MAATFERSNMMLQKKKMVQAIAAENWLDKANVDKEDEIAEQRAAMETQALAEMKAGK